MYLLYVLQIQMADRESIASNPFAALFHSLDDAQNFVAAKQIATEAVPDSSVYLILLHLNISDCTCLPQFKYICTCTYRLECVCITCTLYVKRVR